MNSTPTTSTLLRIESCIRHARELGASDIHIDPTQDAMRVRYRIDGLLRESDPFPHSSHAEVIARLKILSGLRTDEHHAAQDGRFKFEIDVNSYVDIRISIVPTYYGENAVLRLLTQEHTGCTLEMLGFTREHTTLVMQSLARTSGMILITGPTGSGKTTTLYTLLQLLAQRSLSLVSIEDPIEYSIPEVCQIPVHARRGLTFAEGLRSILRQDPDVIMVGEIRDAVTAGLATNAALTGHLVLSTLHTNSAPAAFPRLYDLEVPEYLVRATLRLIIAQRLVRKICTTCRVRNGTEYRGAGCDECGRTGYRGRIGIYEMLSCAERETKEVPVAHLTFADDARIKIQEGLTTTEEFLRSAYE